MRVEDGSTHSEDEDTTGSTSTGTTSAEGPRHSGQVEFWINRQGYYYASSACDGEHSMIGLHQLAAIAGGADPHEVFSEQTHCHHLLGKIDAPATVSVLDADEHLRQHAEGSFDSPAPSQLFDNSGDNTGC